MYTISDKKKTLQQQVQSINSTGNLQIWQLCIPVILSILAGDELVDGAVTQAAWAVR